MFEVVAVGEFIKRGGFISFSLLQESKPRSPGPVLHCAGKSRIDAGHLFLADMLIRPQAVDGYLYAGQSFCPGIYS